MTKLCARGKSAAKRKFKVYPSAYANAYASKICAGKAKDPSGVKRKDWGPKKANEGLMVTVKTPRPKNQRFIKQSTKKSKEQVKQELRKPRQDKKDLPRGLQIDTTTSSYGDAGKGRKVPKFNQGGYTGSFIKSDVGGAKISNKSYEAYYKDLI